jgi:AP-4 complex subunit epsilon-1
MSGMHLSREFFELIKAIGESKSKQEEDRIIASEIIALKKKLDGTSGGGGGGIITMSPGSPIPSMGMGTPGGKGGNNELSSKKKAREFLVRLLYVEMLGHDGSFGFIKAVVSSEKIIIVIALFYGTHHQMMSMPPFCTIHPSFIQR